MIDTALVPSEVRQERLEEWMRDYENDILRVCYLYLADRSTAEDALQDTFLKAWRFMDKYERRNNCSPKTWLMRIAINTCKDYKRSTWFRFVDRVKEADERQNIHASDHVREHQELLDAVMKLPDHLKQAVLLYYYQDMSMEETAFALQISRPTLSKQLKKAYTILHDSLEEASYDEG